MNFPQKKIQYGIEGVFIICLYKLCVEFMFQKNFNIRTSFEPHNNIYRILGVHFILPDKRWDLAGPHPFSQPRERGEVRVREKAHRPLTALATTTPTRRNVTFTTLPK